MRHPEKKKLHAGHLLVFLRHHNDVDHITPILWKFCALFPDVLVNIVLLGEFRCAEDFRFQLLLQFPALHITHLSERLLVEESNIIRDQDGIPSCPSMIFSKLSSHLLETMLKEPGKCVLAFDWIMTTSGPYTDFASQLVRKAKKDFNVTTVMLPHGDRPFSNRFEFTSDLNIQDTDIFSPASLFDYVLVPNKLCAERYQSHLPSKRIKILGSPRYNDEWLRIIQKLSPDLNIDRSTRNKRVLLAVRDPGYSYNWDELVVTAKMIHQINGVELMLLPHPRSQSLSFKVAYPELTDFPLSTTIVLPPSAYPSRVLNFTDLVLDAGCSIAFEAVARRIPVLCPEYFHALRTTTSTFMPEIALNCRDDLYCRISELVSTNHVTTYSEESRQHFMREMIDSTEGRILDKYAHFLKNCLTGALPAYPLPPSCRIQRRNLGISGTIFQKHHDLHQRIGSLQKTIAQQKNMLANRDRAIAQHKTVLANRDRAIAQHKTVLANRDRAIAQHKTVLANRDCLLAEQSQTITQRNETIGRVVRQYLQTAWQLLLNRHGIESAILFGAGKHTIWLLDVVHDVAGPRITAILDDAAKPRMALNGIPVMKPCKFKPKKGDVVVLSTDTLQKQFAARCRELSGHSVKLIDLYEGLPPGPYPNN